MTQKELYFKEAAELDIPLLLEMIQAYYEYDKLDFNKDAATLALKDLVKDPNIGTAFLVHSGKELCGYAILTNGYSIEFHGKTILLDELYFKPDFCGKGLSLPLFQFISEYCKKRGAHALRLEVEHENQRARSAYRKNQFLEHPRALMTRFLKNTNI